MKTKIFLYRLPMSARILSAYPPAINILNHWRAGTKGMNSGKSLNSCFFGITILTITALFLLSSFVFSQGCHEGGGSKNSSGYSGHTMSGMSDNDNKHTSYGGTVKKVGKYNIEMVYEPPLAFYLMNKKGKPVSNQGIIGKAEITYSDKSAGTITLNPRGENGFTGQIINKTQSFICLVTFQINGENVSARFDGGTTGKETTLYTCSMHPEIQSDKPDKCPKCGMNLVKKTRNYEVHKKSRNAHECYALK